MALFVFSDAHLGAGPPEKEAVKLDKLFEFLDQVQTEGDHLVILGDLFDFWFEYKHAIPKENLDVVIRLRELTQAGIRIDYISGNHDFWMGDFFDSQMDIHVHMDSFDLTYAGRQIHFIHGDGLAATDRGYRLLKRVLRNPVAVWLYRKLPPDWAIPLAKRVSGSSREYTARRDHHFAQDYEEYARDKLKAGFDLVAIGHLHLPVFLQTDTGIYINTGDFINHFSYARIDDQGCKLLYVT